MMRSISAPFGTPRMLLATLTLQKCLPRSLLWARVPSLHDAALPPWLHVHVLARHHFYILFFRKRITVPQSLWLSYPDSHAKNSCPAPAFPPLGEPGAAVSAPASVQPSCAARSSSCIVSDPGGGSIPRRSLYASRTAGTSGMVGSMPSSSLIFVTLPSTVVVGLWLACCCFAESKLPDLMSSLVSEKLGCVGFGTSYAALSTVGVVLTLPPDCRCGCHCNSARLFAIAA